MFNKIQPKMSDEIIKHPEKIKITKDAQAVAKQIRDISPQDVAIISNTVAKGTTAEELGYFLSVCKTMNLNPFNKEVWCYKDHKNNLIIFAGRDGMLAKAQQSPYFAGIRSCEVRENDDFIVNIPAGEITHRIKHKSAKDRGPIKCAYAIVFRQNGEPTIEIADFDRYNRDPKTYGKTTSNVWTTHPEAMIKKVAETSALKKAFGISGIQSGYEWDFSGTKAIPINAPPISESYISLLESKLQTSTLSEKRKQEILGTLITMQYNYEAESILEELENSQPESEGQFMERKTEPIQKGVGGTIRYKGSSGNYDKYKNFTDPDIMAISIGWSAKDFKERLETYWRDFEVKKDSNIKVKETGNPMFKTGDVIKIKSN